jgi:hypothetical protein
VPDEVPALVTLDLWGVAARAVPAALLHMGLDRRPVRRTPGLRFAKLLGTGDGRTFTPRDADVHHWGLLATWASPADADAFEDSAVVRSWQRRSFERLHVAMRPLASRGTWAGRRPFGVPAPRRHDGPTAAITRARLRPQSLATFWRAVPPVSERLQHTPGLLLATGIGEAPVGLQGTFSLWDSPDALTAFAHRTPEHQAVVARTAEVGWYAEELFARLAVVEAGGTFGGVSVRVPR